METDNKIVYDLIKEVREEQKEQSKCLSRMEVDVKRNTDDLIVHMEQTKTVKDLHAQNEKRIEYNEKTLYGNIEAGEKSLSSRIGKLEEPDKVKEYLRKKYMKWAAVVAITLTIATGITKILGVW